MKILQQSCYFFDAEFWELEGGTRKKTLIKSAGSLKDSASSASFYNESALICTLNCEYNEHQLSSKRASIVILTVTLGEPAQTPMKIVLRFR